jgi:hypothetical protein
MIAWIFSRIGSGSGSGARRQLSLDQIEGGTKIGLGRITPISDTDEMGELLDNDTESNGDPGAIRTRDPQLRRLFRESCNLPVLLRYSENLVRSRSAMRCHRVTRPCRRCSRRTAPARIPWDGRWDRRRIPLATRHDASGSKLRKLTTNLDQLMRAGHDVAAYPCGNAGF